MMNKLILFIFLQIVVFNVFSQTGTGEKDVYLIRFKDKNNSPYSLDKPTEFLSLRSLERRAKNNVTLTIQDIPVNSSYLDSLRSKGVKILFTSRWFNSATVEADTSLLIKEIEKLSFVKRTEKIYRSVSDNTKQIYTEDVTTSIQSDDPVYGKSEVQIDMLNGRFLHDKGFKGEGILVAVIDGGFRNADSNSAFSHLFEGGKILGVRNVINQQESVFDLIDHGTLVLSAIAGNVPGKLLGTAPEASFLLLRSENGATEYMIEEDAWVSAAEYADSAGADVINSSLGYSDFDNSEMNHTYKDMNGNTARVSIGADIAASKGIIVVCSAGNQGTSVWRHITAPADGDSVLAIGAVDADRKIANFSSRGPSSDGQVKPNVSAMGVKTVVAFPAEGQIGVVNGTSLSAPVITGMAACLIQAFPEVPAMEIFNTIEKSAHLFSHPDYDYGYGVPDFQLAYEILDLKYKNEYDLLKLLELYPNPGQEGVTVCFYSKEDGPITININNIFGQQVFSQEYHAEPKSVNKLWIDFTSFSRSGIYFLSITNGHLKVTKKIVKF